MKKNNIYIYKCKENANIDDLIKYYNGYNIIEQKKIIIEKQEGVWVQPYNGFYVKPHK